MFSQKLNGWKIQIKDQLLCSLPSGPRQPLSLILLWALHKPGSSAWRALPPLSTSTPLWKTQLMTPPPGSLLNGNTSPSQTSPQCLCFPFPKPLPHSVLKCLPNSLPCLTLWVLRRGDGNYSFTKSLCRTWDQGQDRCTSDTDWLIDRKNKSMNIVMEHQRSRGHQPHHFTDNDSEA